MIALDLPPIHLAPHKAGHKQESLEGEEFSQAKKEGVAVPTVLKWIPRIVFVPKNDSILWYWSTTDD